MFQKVVSILLDPPVVSPLDIEFKTIGTVIRIQINCPVL